MQAFWAISSQAVDLETEAWRSLLRAALENISYLNNSCNFLLYVALPRSRFRRELGHMLSRKGFKQIQQESIRKYSVVSQVSIQRKRCSVV